MKKYLLVVFILIIFQSNTFACIIQGKVTDSTGSAMQFVSIYIDKSTNGTTTNPDGRYRLNVEPGSYTLIFKLIGFKLISYPIVVEESCKTIEINKVMYEDKYGLSEVVVSKNNIDPAYAIIKQAQLKRDYYLNKELKEFTCKAYVKSLGKVGKLDIKNKLFGLKLFDLPKISQNQIIYLSEAVSIISYNSKNKYTEKMLHSRVSGQTKSYSFGTGHAMLSEVNFYNNQLPIADIYERPIISPIADNSFSYYKFHLIETFNEQNYTIHKIAVKPIRDQTPCFKGEIYIVDGLWRIHSVNFYMDKSSGIDYVDTLHVQQIFAPLKDSIWVPINHNYELKISADFQIAKGDASGYIVAVFSDYKLKSDESIQKKSEPPTLTKKKAKKKIIKERPALLVVEETANTLDSNAWNEIRPVPLSIDENNDYNKKDSIEVIHQTKIYKDTTDKRLNKPKVLDLIFGYTYRNSFKRTSYSFRPMLNNIQFNSVEGWVVNPNFSFKKTYESGQNFEISPYFRYGFSNKLFHFKLEAEYYYDPLRWAKISAQGGRFVFDFNSSEAITPFINSVYTLFLHQNYLKIYEKDYFKITHSSEVINGVFITTNAEIAARRAMNNTTEFGIINTDQKYTPNNPAAYNAPYFSDNKILALGVTARFTFKQDYIMYPKRKFGLGSKYPILSITYKKAIAGILGTNADYDYVTGKMYYDLDLKKAGRAEIEIQPGGFVSGNQIFFADYKHFNGNQTIIIKPNFSNAFMLLDYYRYSTNTYFLEAHWEHHLNGYITNAIPLFKKLKWQMINSVNYLYTPQIGNYAEFGIGFEHIFQYFRADYFISKGDQIPFSYGVRVGLGF
ncbi:MAG: DUF5686 and carboxypeptidase regulatory-like domain-containing protein [Bacteroidota bacterium]|nr:DUF5686 and carboxypeptidase regulatory-like domain-containing protein [Bacteroidota bacterium]